MKYIENVLIIASIVSICLFLPEFKKGYDLRNELDRIIKLNNLVDNEIPKVIDSLFVDSLTLTIDKLIVRQNKLIAKQNKQIKEMEQRIIMEEMSLNEYWKIRLKQ